MLTGACLKFGFLKSKCFIGWGRIKGIKVSVFVEGDLDVESRNNGEGEKERERIIT